MKLFVSDDHQTVDDGSSQRDVTKVKRQSNASHIINETSKLEICVAINEMDIRIISLNYS